MNQQLAKSVYFKSKNIENIFQELINKTEQEIIDVFKEYETNCTCKKCQSACQRRTCWGLPGEIQKLIDLGYSDRLMIDYYESTDPNFNIEFVYVLTPAIRGYEKNYTPWWPIGICAFYNNGRCDIYEHRPIEARIAQLCQNYKPEINFMMDLLHYRIIPDLWNRAEGKEIYINYQKLVGL